MYVFHVCDMCAVVLANGDTSGVDDATDLERIESFTENNGMLADAGMVSKPGYWDCECCEQVTIGSAHCFETV
jgi:hypothetical protein